MWIEQSPQFSSVLFSEVIASIESLQFWLNVFHFISHSPHQKSVSAESAEESIRAMSDSAMKIQVSATKLMQNYGLTLLSWHDRTMTLSLPRATKRSHDIDCFLRLKSWSKAATSAKVSQKLAKSGAHWRPLSPILPRADFDHEARHFSWTCICPCPSFWFIRLWTPNLRHRFEWHPARSDNFRLCCTGTSLLE